MWQRVAARQGRQAVRQGQIFVKHVVPAVIKPARTLWNEVIGFVFTVIGVMFGSKAIHLYLAYANAAETEKGAAMGRFALAAFCTALMLWFGLTSFLRARRISRS